MKGLAELTAENDALGRRAEERDAASIKRLKARIAGYLHDPMLPAPLLRRRINAAIDAWRKAEAMRGGR